MSNPTEKPLDKLIAEVRALPERHNRAAIVNRLKAIATKTSSATQSMEHAFYAKKGLAAVSASPPTGNPGKDRHKVATVARELVTFIQGRKVGQASKKDETSLATIVETADRLYKDAGKAWKSYFVDRLEGYQKLSNAAREANLTGYTALNVAVASLSSTTTVPPVSDEEIAEVKAALEDVLDRIANLGLQGAPGEFLISAVRGDATISAMQNEEVQRFFESHPTLVNMLRIKLS